METSASLEKKNNNDVSRIKEWPQEDRPREKLLARGSESLTDAEVLAVILGTGNASIGCNALDLARALLARFDTLAGLSVAGISELTEVRGVGPAKAVQVKAALELARRLSSAVGRPGTRYHTSEDIFREYHPRLQPLRQEVFIVVLLDVKNRRIRDVTISQGSLTEAIVHPREVFIPVLRESAASIVLIHNHPSGDPSPSRADLELTRRLQATADMMGVAILDHLIIGYDSYVSFVDRGLLKPRMG